MMIADAARWSMPGMVGQQPDGHLVFGEAPVDDGVVFGEPLTGLIEEADLVTQQEPIGPLKACFRGHR